MATIALLAPDYYFRRAVDGFADLPVSGSYTGSPAPTAIEGRWNGGSWVAIDASPSGGTFAGWLTKQPAGQGTLEVRFANDPSVTDSAAFVSIGHVFLVTGQSNAAGDFANHQAYSHPTLKAVLSSRLKLAWHELSDAGRPNGSVWPLVATQVMSARGVPVAFITVAQHGTSLDADGGWEPGVGLQYAEMIAHVRATGINGIDACLWDQGESETHLLSPATQSSYRQALVNLHESLSADLGFLCSMIVAQTGAVPYDTGSTVEGIDEVRRAQMQAWNEPKIYPGPVGYDRAGIHWKTDAEALALAGRWWLSIENALFGGRNGRGPYVRSAVEDETRSMVRLSLSKPLKQGLAPSTDWFRVTDDGVEASIVSVGYEGAAITLALAAPLRGQGHVTFASGNGMAGRTDLPVGRPITLPNGTTVCLPMEPVIDFAISPAPPVASGTPRVDTRAASLPTS